jgi:hypothetical protein
MSGEPRPIQREVYANRLGVETIKAADFCALRVVIANTNQISRLQ